MSVVEKLMRIQTTIKVPKSQYNKFGKYNYRNCEDILCAIKPLLQEEKCIILISDDLVLIGNRYYIKAEAKIVDCETGEKIYTNAYAREDEDKKGMDASQVTGATSSYARKYALNGLLCIDDSKDADSYENNKDADSDEGSKTDKPASEEQKKTIRTLCSKHKIDIDMLYASNGISEKEVTEKQAGDFLQSFKKKYGDD